MQKSKSGILLCHATEFDDHCRLYVLQNSLAWIEHKLQAGTPRGGAEGVIARGPGDTEGPWVQNCQNRMQNYGLRTPPVYLGGAIVLCTPPPFDSAF